MPPVKNLWVMTSYGGIIRIRLRVEVDYFLSACHHKLPCISLLSHYTAVKEKMQASNHIFCTHFYRGTTTVQVSIP